MQMRRLGRKGAETAPIILGGNVFGWTADRKTSFALLDHFVNRGFNAIDTADAYSAWVPGHRGGESETIIGEWLAARKRRYDVVIMTKVAKWRARPGLSRQNILAAIDDSLRRLRTDFIDVYFAHEDDPDTPLEETLAAFGELQRAGKVRSLGASNYSAARLAEALHVSDSGGLPRYEVLQPEYNLHSRKEYEGDLARLAAANGMSVVPYFALAAGFLTGKYRSRADIEGTDRERMLGGFFDERGARILASLDRIAAAKSAKPAHVALAWLIHKEDVTAPIASARNVDQLEEMLLAAQIELSGEEMDELDAAGAWPAHAPGDLLPGT